MAVILDDKKYHFAQLSESGALHIVFVGTVKELEAQIKKDFEEMISKGEEAITRCKAELAKLTMPDLANITEENAEEAKKWIFYTSQLLKLEREVKESKCPTINDGTYFVLEHLGKCAEVEK